MDIIDRRIGGLGAILMLTLALAACGGSSREVVTETRTVTTPTPSVTTTYPNGVTTTTPSQTTTTIQTQKVQ